MTPAEFVAKWSRNQQKETAVVHSYFNDICALVGHKPPLVYATYNRAFSHKTQSAFDKETRQSVTRAQIQELDDLHITLDNAVLAAYGWPFNLTDEQILERLLTLNLERAV